MTLEEAQVACAEWQNILRLQDWEIHVRFAHSSSFPSEQEQSMSQAEVHVEERLHYAVVRLIFPEDYSHGDGHPQDMEQCLVHELLHIHFYSFRLDADSPEFNAVERVIETISQSLVGLKRGNHG